MTRKRIVVHIVAVCIGLLLLGSAAGAVEPPVAGGVLPDLRPGFSLPKPQDGIVIIEIFSMYCPYCQREAPNVNALYEKIQAAPPLRNRVKLVGIGVGNSSYEVGVFRDKYKVRFPLYPDGDFSIHKRLGEPRTPYFIGVKINPDGSHRIFYAKLGEIGDVDRFLAEMIRLSGLKP